jgi:hypothetical protein
MLSRASLRRWTVDKELGNACQKWAEVISDGWEGLGLRELCFFAGLWDGFPLPLVIFAGFDRFR